VARVILIRHGETDWNRSRHIQGGSSDTPLNDEGQEQAERLALRLKSEEIQAIYASPLRRARNTAEAIARHHRLPVTIDPSLKEIEVGELEGVAIAKLGKYLTQLLIEISPDGTLPKMPGGESLAELQQRVWPPIHRLADQSNGVSVVVSHYFVILAIICKAINLPLSQIGRLRVNASSISRITFDERGTRLTLLNDTGHLPNIEI
jgi:probable phosphoglycerate mutase